MDLIETADAIHDYVSTYSALETRRAYKYFYDLLIKEQYNRSLATQEAKSIGEKVVLEYFMKGVAQ